MKVVRYDYVSQFGLQIDSLIADLRSMLLDGRYILSKEVADFERSLGNYLGSRFVFGVNTGTDALVIALMALGVGREAEVITQANTFHATVAGIRLSGAKPVLVDAEEDSFLIDRLQVEAAITTRTRVLLPVHIYGKATPMGELLALSKKHSLLLVEDAAQAHGARWDNQMVGSIGDIGCFSFHPSKNLAAAGDGGALCTNREEFATRIQEYRALGQRGQNNHVRLGMNSKLDAIQALILKAKLPHLDEWNARRREIAGMYRERLAELPLSFQAFSAGEQHVYHLFQVRTDRRDALLSHLCKAGVDAVIRYPVPIHLQPAFADCGWKRGQFPVAERLANELLCLPIRPNLTVAEIDYVAESVRSFFR